MAAVLAALNVVAEPVQLKIATYNLRRSGTLPHDQWATRAPRCLELLAAEKFDIFGSQETQSFHIQTITQAGYSFIGEPRDANPNSEYSAIFYNPEVLELQSHKTFWLSETPDVPGSRSWETACTRICTWGIFKHKASGKLFAFVNTHLDHRSLPAKENGIKLILQKRSDFPSDMPYILTGDFNSQPPSTVYQLVSSALSDARHIAKKLLPGPPQTFHNYQSDPAARKTSAPIDYIFVDKSTVQVNSFQVLDDFKNNCSSSDHFPVVAEITL